MLAQELCASLACETAISMFFDKGADLMQGQAECLTDLDSLRKLEMPGVELLVWPAAAKYRGGRLE